MKAAIPPPQRHTGRPYIRRKNQATAVDSGDARNMEAEASGNRKRLPKKQEWKWAQLGERAAVLLLFG